MSTLYWINITVHVLAALLWLGGMFFLGIVGAPVLRHVEPASLRQRLFHDLGVRFRIVGWIAISVLVITGTLNLYFRGYLRWEGALGSATFWTSPYGHALGMKLVAVTAMLVIGAIHDFLLGPRAGVADPGSPEALRLRSRAAMLGRVNALIGVLVVIAAVRLARGG